MKDFCCSLTTLLIIVISEYLLLCGILAVLSTWKIQQKKIRNQNFEPYTNVLIIKGLAFFAKNLTSSSTQQFFETRTLLKVEKLLEYGMVGKNAIHDYIFVPKPKMTCSQIFFVL
jgi:vancomycin permeability regulator SanA